MAGRREQETAGLSVVKAPAGPDGACQRRVLSQPAAAT